MSLMPIYYATTTKIACIAVKLTIGGRPLDEPHYFQTIVGAVENTFGHVEAYDDDLGPLTISAEYELFENPFLAWKADRPVPGDPRIPYDVVPILEDVVSSSLETQIYAKIEKGVHWHSLIVHTHSSRRRNCRGRCDD
ncbi:hypothetical protein V8C34DRAFT_274448 [Trichoderma compactum]